MDIEATKKKKKAKRTSNGDRKILLGGISLVVGIIIFALLGIIQNKVFDKVETKAVVVAKTDIPQGIVLDEINMQDYFEVKQREAATLPAGTFANGYGLLGKVTGRKILANEVITEGCLAEKKVYGDVVDPVELSIDVSKIGAGVAGTLRAGDLIDIKAIIAMDKTGIMEDEETQEFISTNAPDVNVVDYEEITAEDNENEDDNLSDLDQNTIDTLDSWGVDRASYEYIEGLTGEYLCVTIAKNVQVTGVFTSNGVNTKDAEADGTAQVATVLTVVVPRSMQDSIYLALAEGTIYVSRVVDTTAFEVEETEAVLDTAGTGEAVEDISEEVSEEVSDTAED